MDHKYYLEMTVLRQDFAVLFQPDYHESTGKKINRVIHNLTRSVVAMVCSLVS